MQAAGRESRCPGPPGATGALVPWATGALVPTGPRRPWSHPATGTLVPLGLRGRPGSHRAIGALVPLALGALVPLGHGAGGQPGMSGVCVMSPGFFTEDIFNNILSFLVALVPVGPQLDALGPSHSLLGESVSRSLTGKPGLGNGETARRHLSTWI